MNRTISKRQNRKALNLSLKNAVCWLFEVRDSDGNDCTVYDVVVNARTLERASAALWAHLKRCYPDDETDGGYGTFHPCNCHEYVSCEHQSIGFCEKPKCQRAEERFECQGHGGLLTNEDCDGEYGPRQFPNFERASEECRVYHCKVYLDHNGYEV